MHGKGLCRRAGGHPARLVAMALALEEISDGVDEVSMEILAVLLRTSLGIAKLLRVKDVLVRLAIGAYFYVCATNGVSPSGDEAEHYDIATDEDGEPEPVANSAAVRKFRMSGGGRGGGRPTRSRMGAPRIKLGAVEESDSPRVSQASPLRCRLSRA